MSTRSMIAMQDADNSVIAIYCHFDGYLEHMGKVLMENCKSSDDVASLLSRGEMRCLLDEKEVDAGEYNFPHLNRVERGNGLVSEHFEPDFEKREIEYYENLEEATIAFEASDREFFYLWDDEAECWKYKKKVWDYEDRDLANWNEVPNA